MRFFHFLLYEICYEFGRIWKQIGLAWFLFVSLELLNGNLCRFCEIEPLNVTNSDLIDCFLQALQRLPEKDFRDELVQNS